MQVAIVNVHVKPEHVDDFVVATVENAKASTAEPGNMRFDVLQSPEDPTRFVLYEAYQTAEAAAAHKGTAHYQKWRDAVAGWMASPRAGVPYNSMFP